MADLPAGVRHIPMCLSWDEQRALLSDIRSVVKHAPLYTPTMPRTGKPMSVRMTNCGALGWVTDLSGGYRYQSSHPVTGKAWPKMPQRLLDLWQEFANYPLPPEACLINFYTGSAKMGLHQDKDEDNFEAPVLSISLGDDCLFRIGGTNRNEPTQSIKLHSGDVLLLQGESRLAYHGVDRIYPDTSTLLSKGGRINLTLRRVTKADEVSDLELAKQH